MKDISLVVFDMDGTIVQYPEGSFQSSWDAVGFAAGKKKEWEELLNYYYPRQDLYEEWFNQNLKCLKGTSLDSVTSQIFPPPYTPGFPEFCTLLKQKDLPAGILSSGIDLVADRILEEQNLNFALTNIVHIKDGYFSGTGEHVVPLWKKGELLQEIIASRHLDPQNVAYFGDNENDLPCWELVGLKIGISLKKPELYSKVDYHFPDFQGAIELFRG